MKNKYTTQQDKQFEDKVIIITGSRIFDCLVHF